MYRLSFQIIIVLISINLFAQTAPHGDGFDQDCSLCHNSDNWNVDLTKVEFDHSQTKFSLEGQHQNVDCKSCHTSLVFSSAKTDCISCHTDIHQGTVGFECANCHTPTTWIVKNIIGVHQSSRFPLVGAHKLADCAQCHAGYTELRFDVENADCYTCHQSEYQSTTDPNHVAENYPTDCTVCHNTTNWDDANFDHNLTQFPLTGAHTSVACATCHTSGYTGTPTECYACHQSEYQSTTDPNHVAENYPTDCTVCHNTTNWDDANFDHNLTQFPLTGAHTSVACATCHTSGYTGTPAECYACHQSDYQSTTDPNHVAENYPTDCTVCHNTTNWDDANFDHNLTQFPLTGAHTSVACATCHTSGYTGTPAECYACHQSDYQSTADPNHVAENYPTDCTVCHNTTNWDDANFDHNLSQFPLTGAHISVACATCHTSGYTGTPAECYACHQSDYQSTTDPNHVAENYPHDCTLCHNTSNWDDANFDHNLTQFPLTGAHISVACANCHTSGYTGTPADCYSCHQTDFNGTTDPNHVTENYPHDCTLCHSTSNWDDATFDHNLTQFPLTGAHTTVACANCHTSGYTGTPADCYSCHQNDFNGTTDPNHVTENYPHDCTLCHSTSNWDDATFDHNLTQFPLTGAHTTVACANCHTSGYTGTPADCYSCHQTDFNNTINPNHSAAGITTNCETCHTSSAWVPSTFNHTTTGFELLGSHQPLQCSSCHAGTLTGLDNTCITCHQSDFNSAPNHVTQSYPTTCELCHNAIEWNQTSFDHNITQFPLTGAHISVACATCHTSGYTGTPTDCYSCHQDDFNGTTDPNHVTENYPHDCTLCHSTSNWDDSNFDHNLTQFPLTGAHTSVACANCHATGYTGTPTDCYSCHQDDFNGTTDPNHVAENYPHDCTLCHSTSNWDDANFDHNITQFPLTGAHTSVACANCHTSGYTGTPTECFACHQDDFNATADPPHQTLNFSGDCLSCHTTNGWTPANFDHSFFPIGNNHNNVDCNECHSETNYQPQCLSCHLDDFLDEHDQGDRTDCWNCHETNDWDNKLISPGIKGLKVD